LSDIEKEFVKRKSDLKEAEGELEQTRQALVLKTKEVQAYKDAISEFKGVMDNISSE